MSLRRQAAPQRLPPGGALPRLRWPTRRGGRFAALAPEGLALGGMNVPVEGIAAEGRVLLFFSDGWNVRAGRPGHSVCAAATGADVEARGKKSPVVMAAIARELAGFVWAIGRARPA